MSTTTEASALPLKGGGLWAQPTRASSSMLLRAAPLAKRTQAKSWKSKVSHMSFMSSFLTRQARGSSLALLLRRSTEHFSNCSPLWISGQANQNLILYRLSLFLYSPSFALPSLIPQSIISSLPFAKFINRPNSGVSHSQQKHVATTITPPFFAEY